MFYQFIKHKKTDMINYKIVDWQRFFVKNASTRTLCQDCDRDIEIYHMKLKKKLRDIERKRLGLGPEDESDDSDVDDDIQDDVVTIEGRKQMVR